MPVYKFPSQKALTIEPNFLSGWKDIAHYLGKGVRTVQRYEQELALPVRRPDGRVCGSVIAFRVELDHWVSASPIRLPAKTRLDSQTTHHLKIEVVKLQRLCAEGHELMEAIIWQRTRLESGIGEVVQALFGADFLRGAGKHEAIAAQQKARARTMIESAREMSDRAIEMRPPQREWLMLAG
jgi:hypothetical protein